MTLNELAESSHKNAVEKGFYNQIRELMNHPYLTLTQKGFIRTLWLGNRLMLIVTELAEGYEGVRKGNYSCQPKSGGLGEELADAQIRLADFAKSELIDLEKAVEDKAEFNSGRPFMHGGKTV